jgi:hypothetical protein
MSNDYLWDRSGTPDPDIKWLEDLLAPLAHDAPLDELRLAKARRPARATPQEPVEAPASGRVKGKMSFFDKRVIGTATITAALCLFGGTLYERHASSPRARSQPAEIHTDDRPPVSIDPRGWTHASAVAPTTGADLAITAGESASIHVPFGAVEVEIQTRCNAEIEMTAVMQALMEGHVAHPGDPPATVLTETLRQVEGDPPSPIPVPISQSVAGDPIIAGTESADGRATSYHLIPGIGPAGVVQYTARCVGRPPMHGVLVIDGDDARGPIGPTTNARIWDDANELRQTLEYSIHVAGTVSPSAAVSIDGVPVWVRDSHEPRVASFSVDVPISAKHPVAAVRVDDATGTQFYVYRRSIDMVPSCEGSKQAAATLAARGDIAGALDTLETATQGARACKPDRDTYSRALEYACKAGDADVARTFWHKLPPEMQRALAPLCAQNAITRDSLDKP